MAYSNAQGDALSEYDVIIIGGGWAGLSASTHLAQKGLKCLLIEKGEKLGGRASSYYDKDFAENLDHGPHLFLGAYDCTLNLLKIWGAEETVEFNKDGVIQWYDENGKYYSLNTYPNLGKLGTLMGFMRFSLLTLSERINVCKVLNSFLSIDIDNNQTVKEYLLGNGVKKPNEVVFWNTITESALNAKTNEAPLSLLVTVLKRGLLAGGSKSLLGKAKIPLAQICDYYAKEWLILSGIELKTFSNVKKVQCKEKGAFIVITDKEKITSKSVVLAITAKDCVKLLPDNAIDTNKRESIADWHYSPIITIHIDFSHEVLPTSFACFWNGFVHWVFGRGEPTNVGWRKISALTSVAEVKSEFSNDAHAITAVKEIRYRLKIPSSVKIEKQKVIRMVRATPLFNRSAYKSRITTETNLNGLFLAGDIVQSQLPSTIEGSALTGKIAAQKVKQYLSNYEIKQ